MNTKKTYPKWTRAGFALAMAASIVIWPGCQTHKTEMAQGEENEPALKPLAESPTPNTFTLKSALLQLNKRVPEKATLGTPIQANINVVALAKCANIVITDTIPAGSTYIKSDPVAQVADRTLTWKVDSMEKGQTMNATVWYKADTEGRLINCSTMTATPRDCVAMFVGKPAITIEKSGPETVKLGSTINYRIIVKNTGNADAENVVVTDSVPEGLRGPSDKAMTFNVGTLLAGQTKEIPVALKAIARGKHCNVVSVTTSNAGNAKDETCTVVTQAGLSVTKTGTTEQFLGRNASYQIVVSNTGDTNLQDVIVTDTAASATKFISAPGATISGNTATWKIVNLAKGGKQVLDVLLTSTSGGRHCDNVVATAEGISEFAEACTEWKGVAAILLETKDDPDPIQVGENVMYIIRVTNQGTAKDTNIKLVANFGKEVSPVSASVGGKVEGNTVKFAALATLEPKQVVTYTITAKGAATGDHRLKVSLTSDVLSAAVIHEESTRVY